MPPYLKIFFSNALFLCFIAGSISGNENLDTRISVGFESKYFKNSPKWSEQSTDVVQTSVEGYIELFYPFSESYSITFSPFIRKDGIDEYRDLFDVREGYLLLESNQFEMLFGINTVFWGVTESINIVDVINQVDTGDISGDQKLGQPMVNLQFLPEYGTFSLYLLPYFRERNFPGNEGRFRGPVVIEKSASKFESSDDLHNLDIALRYSHYFADIDFGLSYFKGTSREPLILSNAQEELSLHYAQISQIGLDVQYTYLDWLFKSELTIRNGFSETYFAAVSGFEYTLYQIFNSDSDFSILMEYHQLTV